MLVPQDPDVELVAENEDGAIRHDRSLGEWMIDLKRHGITLYFDQEEFERYLRLFQKVLEERDGALLPLPTEN